MNRFYVGIDLHAKTSQICVIGGEGEKLAEAGLKNDLPGILEFLSPFPGAEVVIESTINWYWIVDALADAGYKVRLAHTLGLFMITGAKVKTDRRDAHKLARLLRLGEIPEGHIYPAEKRYERDLLRRRLGLVRSRASLYTSLRVQLMKHNLNDFSLSTLKRLSAADLEPLPLPEQTKWYFSLVLEQVSLLSRQIGELDDYLATVALKDEYFRALIGLPGIHHTLGLMVYYETGDVSRFSDSSRYASYCRLVPGVSESAGKAKRGRGTKQGNPYLKYAFTQAANISVRYYPKLRAFRDRHANKRGGPAKVMVANCILAHRLSTAAYHVLKTGEPYEEDRLFSS